MNLHELRHLAAGGVVNASWGWSEDCPYAMVMAMRPSILTDAALAEIDAKADLDALERIPTDAGAARSAYREMWPRVSRPDNQPNPWDEWVRLP